uniref:Uncharacterized protein n=1 Tax=Peronospora matthiolae TaxID=2874970 RepID=A0AAV1TA95_9STRA
MRCAAEAVRKAVARLRVAEESTSLASSSGDPSPAAAIQQQAVAVTPRATETSAASAACSATRNADQPELELIYSGESDDASDSKATPPAPEDPGRTLQDPGGLALGNVAASRPRSSDREFRLTSSRLAQVHPTIGRVAIVVKHVNVTTMEQLEKSVATGVSDRVYTTQEARDRNIK